MTSDPGALVARARRASWPAQPPAARTLRLLGLAALGLGSGFVLAQPVVPAALTTLAAVLLATAVPGMALARALFPGQGMGRAEGIAVTVGLQLALIVLCGFLLHLLRPGLSAASWGALLADITLVACAVAAVRSRRIDTQPPKPSVVTATTHGWLATLAHAPTSQVAMLVGAGAVAVLALVVARAGVVAQPQPAWTALGIAAADAGRAVNVSITNAEGHAETYRLVATLDGEPLATIDDLTLADDASVTRTFALPPAGAFLRAVEVDLWRSGDPPEGEPYRSVRLSSRGVPGS